MNKKIAALAALAAIGACAHAESKPATGDTIMTTSAVSSYILLDRTGSMSSIWDEALTSVNTYAKAVGEEENGEPNELSTSVTLAAFDFQNGLQFDVLRKGVAAQEWPAITSDEISPRGMTPLFDAINRTILLAEEDNPEKAVIVIMTDGKENSSKEVTKAGAKAALDRAEKRGWEVVFLGAEFSNFGDADAVGVERSKQMAISKDNLSVTQERLAKKARAYGKGEEAEITFDEEDRAVAGEEDVKQRKGGS